MNWVSSSLQLAGTLLESVDQRAALTLSATEGDAADHSGAEDGAVEGEGLLSTIKKGISRAKETAVGGARADEEDWEERAEEALEETSAVGGAGPPRSSGGAAKYAAAVRSPPGSNSSAKSAVRQTPPHSGNGRAHATSAHSSPSAATVGGAASSSALEAECARLKKENAKLKTDLRLKDKTLATQQQSLQVYEEEIEALERECKGKLAEGQQQLAQLRMEKDADEKNFVQALELKESQLQALTTDFKVLKEAERRKAEEMELLRAEIARAEESKDSMWTNAASASQQSEEVVTSLRVELQEAQQALNNAKREFADAKLKMYERQSHLEKTNAELSTSVATLGRELEKANEAIVASGVSAGQGAQASLGSGIATTAAYAQLQEDHRKVQQTLVHAKKTLHDETRRNEIQRQEVLGLAEEVKRLKEALVSAQDESSKQVILLTKSNAALQDKLAQWEATSAHQTSTHDSEARIQTLTNRLIEKQESIDALRSRVTTLEVRLTDAQSRSQTAEDKLAQIERSGGVVTMDMEMGTPVGRKGGVRARSNRMANAISRVAPVLERSTRVVSALDVLDRWLLFLGRVFLSMPVARLALLCYVALIHFWVFVVLSFHTSHLNEEVHESAGVAGAAAAKGHGLGAPGLFPDGMQVPPGRQLRRVLAAAISRLLRSLGGHASSHVSRSASSSPASTPRARRHLPVLVAVAVPSASSPLLPSAPPSDDPDVAFSYFAMSEVTLVSPSSVSLDVDLSSVLPSSSSASALHSSTTSVVSPLELAWLRRCLPVFVQPQVDVTNGNGLVKVFFRFERDADSGRLDCQLCVVLAGEASYNRVWPTRENCVATWLYRTFNRRTYKRTADINYMAFHGVDLTPDAPTPWHSVFSVDHGGEQRWAQGDKADVGCWFSLMHHYREDVAYVEWAKDATHRPRVYLNTCNHMISQSDTNDELPKHEWTDYAVEEGDAEDAFHYAVQHVPTKCNLYSLVCFWAARNGGHCADGLLRDCGGRGRQGVATRSRQSLYVQAPATAKAAADTKLQ